MKLDKLIPIAGAGLIALAIFKSSGAKPTGLVIPKGSILVVSAAGKKRAFGRSSGMAQGALHGDGKLKRPGENITVRVTTQNLTADADGVGIKWPFKLIVSPMVEGSLAEVTIPTLPQKMASFEVNANTTHPESFYYVTPSDIGMKITFDVQLLAAISDPNGIAVAESSAPYTHMDMRTAGDYVEVVSGGAQRGGGVSIEVSQ